MMASAFANNILLPWLLLHGLVCALFLVWTWGLAHERRLPSWYALFGLLFLTGSVYVMTLPARNDPEGLWRARMARSLKKPANRVLLGLLTIYMGIALVMGGLALAMIPFVGTSWVHIYVLDGGEAKTFREVLPTLPWYVYVTFLGVFHFIVTRPRVKELVRPA